MDKLFLIDFSKYSIKENGTIISKSPNYFGHVINGSKDKNGYLSVYLRCINNKSKIFLLHRVIWFYFNGEIPQGLEINHKDENKLNNSIGNLELLTRKENVNYGTRNLRVSKKNSISQKGRKLSKEHIFKISLAHSKPIIQYNIETNEVIKEWKSSKEASNALGFNSSTIGKVCRGIYNQAYGYGWKYA